MILDYFAYNMEYCMKKFVYMCVLYMCDVRVCMCACVRVRACVRACVCVRVCVRACVRLFLIRFNELVSFVFNLFLITYIFNYLFLILFL